MPPCRIALGIRAQRRTDSSRARGRSTTSIAMIAGAGNRGASTETFEEIWLSDARGRARS